MKAKAVTVGIPISDLAEAVSWYRRAFDLGEPDLIPMDGIVEWDLGAFWLQLTAPSGAGDAAGAGAGAVAGAGEGGLSLNISVESASTEQARFLGLGLVVTDVTRFEGVVEFFELTDLDGNRIGFVTELN